jgi:Protein of unknown function (DUF3307)
MGCMNVNDAGIGTALLLIVMLQLKHAVCDGPLQTLRMVQDKSHYGRPHGLLHAAIHGGGTLLVLLLVGLPVQMAGSLALTDAILHYHIDFTKENIVKKAGWKTDSGPFWWALTTDQTLHHMTYVLLVWLALKP